MKSMKYILLIAMFFTIGGIKAHAGPPMGRDFGLGIMVGEPTGFTGKLWMRDNTALAFTLGSSYLGKVRIGMDYLWHFDAFNSNVVKLYAGPGVAVGIGASNGWWYTDKGKPYYRTTDETGFGARALFGMNIIPRNTPIEFFGEVGVMIGLLPENFTNTEFALGARFYF